MEGFEDDDGQPAASRLPQPGIVGAGRDAASVARAPSAGVADGGNAIGASGGAKAEAGNAEAANAEGANADAGGNGRLDRSQASIVSRPTVHTAPSSRLPRASADGKDLPVYGALDLGTNNCRLLLARPSRRGFQVVDAFSRIIRLGEGVSQSGTLSEAAMARTIDALRICAQKIERHGVKRAMLVATEACRVASNGVDFLDQVHSRTGLRIEILSRESEARLAVSGCVSLVDPKVDYALVFDIGGGSSELIWLDLTRIPRELRGGMLGRSVVQDAMVAWTSLPVGVVSLAEQFGGGHVTETEFEDMVRHVLAMLEPFEAEHQFARRMAGRSTHMLGTSGTVTTVAGVYLRLPRYDRSRVDGCWLEAKAARDIVYDLLGRSFSERVAEPCIGRDRADLVLAGCAILEALMRRWPCPRLRVADRGLREGILMQLMSEDRVMGSGRRRRRRRGGSRRG